MKHIYYPPEIPTSIANAGQLMPSGQLIPVTAGDFAGPEETAAVLTSLTTSGIFPDGTNFEVVEVPLNTIFTQPDATNRRRYVVNFTPPDGSGIQADGVVAEEAYIVMQRNPATATDSTGQTYSTGSGWVLLADGSITWGHKTK